MTVQPTNNTTALQWAHTEALIRKLGEIMAPDVMGEVEGYLRANELGLALAVISDVANGGRAIDRQ